MTQRHRPPATTADRGSVTPLVIAMMLCLLLLGAGITAAGSAFLQTQRLQHLCDGAATAAAGTITDTTTDREPVMDTVNAYLAVRSAAATTALDLNGTTLTLTCTASNPITLGNLFGHPTLTETVTAAAQTNYRNQ